MSGVVTDAGMSYRLVTSGYPKRPKRDAEEVVTDGDGSITPVTIVSGDGRYDLDSQKWVKTGDDAAAATK